MPIIKRIYLYNDSHLPEDGWIQACFNCSVLTSKTVLFKTIYKDKKLYEFYSHTCADCQKKFNYFTEDWLEFNDSCNSYIKSNFKELFSGRA